MRLMSQPNALTTTELNEQIEAACNEANRLYCAGEDTTAIDAEVDRLMAAFEAMS